MLCLTSPVWIIQVVYFFGSFINYELIVGNTSFFFCVECAKRILIAIIPDICSVLFPFCEHSDQTSGRIGLSTFKNHHLFCFLCHLVCEVRVFILIRVLKFVFYILIVCYVRKFVFLFYYAINFRTK